LLSSIFIPEINLRGMPYGTRSSSVMMLTEEEGDEEMVMETVEH